MVDHDTTGQAAGGDDHLGEPGIGKTALLDTFVAQVSAIEHVWVGHGQCVEHYGAGEPYLPLLEALGRLCRGPAGVSLVALLHQYAPSRHLTKGLALLNTLPHAPERAQHELLWQTALGSALITTKGEASPEVEQAYARARELCQQVEDVPRLFTALWGLRLFYVVQGALPTARKLGEQLLILAQRVQDPLLLLGAHQGWGQSSSMLENCSWRKHISSRALPSVANCSAAIRPCTSEIRA